MFRRKWFYFTLLFAVPKSRETHSVSVRFEENQMGMNRINNIKAGEELDVNALLINIIHHGRMTEAQWEKGI